MTVAKRSTEKQELGETIAELKAVLRAEAVVLPVSLFYYRDELATEAISARQE
jgi:hypothetical protein